MFNNLGMLIATIDKSPFYAIFLAFILGLIFCPLLIPVLKRLKFGQTVRHEGLESHYAKTGTPTMGGFAFVAAITLTSLFFNVLDKDMLFVLLTMLAFCFVGFWDDYIKVVKKRSLGLRAYQKIISQLLITTAMVVYLYLTDFPTSVILPFAGGKSIELGFLFYPFFYFFVIGLVNSVNLNDGIDGLATSVTLVVFGFFFVVSFMISNSVSPILGAGIGALLAYLLFNSNPAKVFMGDTGSFALGGLLAGVATLFRMPLFIILVGFVYLLEAVSVMLQVSYFKITKGKRLFRMAPIHHHFEKLGMKEPQVVALFTVATVILCFVAFLALC